MNGKIHIKVKYLSDSLRKLLRKEEETVKLPTGYRSGDFIDFLAKRHPKIFKKFGPGCLGFTKNGAKPHVLELLEDGDIYEFVVWTDQEIAQDEITEKLKKFGAIVDLPRGEFKMPEWMECTWRRVQCGKDECRICGRIKQDRLRHIMKGEDPDDTKNVFEDAGNSLGEAMAMIKMDAERFGIDIINMDDIKEPPKPSEFPFYLEVNKWQENISAILNRGYENKEMWVFLEAADDLSWYSTLLPAKTYRQLCNRWHLNEDDSYGEFDHKYTRYVLQECLKIIEKSLSELSAFNVDLMLPYSTLPGLKEKALKI